MRTFKRIANRGFTLVELMIVVAIIGVLAALAIYGVRKYLLNAKTAEAKEGIGRMAKDAASAYDGEHMAADVLGLGASTGVGHSLCLTATAAVPSDITMIQGRKYQSNPTEWDSGDKDTGWQCLKFSMRDPQYYQYDYIAGDSTKFATQAMGDLNGDATYSTFTLSGSVQGTPKTVTIAPTFDAVKPEE